MADNKLQRLPFPQVLDKFKNEIARALPSHLNAERMARIALTEFRRQPKLAECDPLSVFAAVVIAAQCGLEPGVMGDGWLVPYKGQCQFIPGYQGLIKLVRNGGMVTSIEAHAVYTNEEFSYQTGMETTLRHVPCLDGDPGALRLVYAVAHMKGGGCQVEVMNRAQVERIRNRSQGYRAAKQYNKETPWETDEAEMWRKTAIRRIVKMLPKSAELSMALALDDAAHRGEQKIELQDAIDGTWAPPLLAEGDPEDEPTGAVEALNAEVVGEAPAPGGVDLGFKRK